MNTNQLVRGQPSKSFFVDMITRDLTAEDSILDLIDNAIDEAVGRQKVEVMSVLTGGEYGENRFRNTKIDIVTDNAQFSIQDNCGGISIDKATNTVFRFGNPEDRPPLGGLSVYGIGMKRSFFKLGRSITVRSTTQNDRFEIDIDVDAWKAKGDNDWDFEFEYAEARNSPATSTGTEITITRLTDDARRSINHPSFTKALVGAIESTYALFLEAGLEIVVNGQAAVSKLPADISADDKITPARKEFEAQGVNVLIIAGVSPRGDRRRYGWDVFCNGRKVLGADRTAVTGWGTRGLPKWHTKFGHFVGYVYFHSSDVRKLPWRTTKQGVVIESSIYQSALGEMRLQARPVINFLNDLYPDQLEAVGIVEREVLEGAKVKPLSKLGSSDTAFRVTLPESPSDPAAEFTSIQWFFPPSGG